MIRLFLPAAVLALALSGSRGESNPTDNEPLAVAERYLAAYEALDFDRLLTFWTDDSVWQDPTGAEIGASPAPVRGATAIRDHLLAATNGIEAVEFDLPERFHSGGQVVNIGTFRYTLDGTALGAPGKRARFEMRTVIVLEVRDGKVLSHTDYADFSDWQEQLQRSLK